MIDKLERALRYAANCEPAVSGSSGHNATFGVAAQICQGFDLTEDATFEVLRDGYNALCKPPWSERDLRHKAREAAKAQSKKPRGWLLNEDHLIASPPVGIRPSRKPRPETEKEPMPIHWSNLHPGTADELEQLRRRRKLPESDGLDIAQRCGVLTFGTNRGVNAWAIVRGHDVLEWRRMDGKKWIQAHGKKSDSWVRYSGAKKRLIGMHLLGEHESVILVEGGPDTLAAFVALELEDAIADWAIVGLLGSWPLERDDLALLADRRIRIAAHDEDDYKAARKWTKQLREVGCRVEPLDLEGLDLDEWVSSTGEVFHD